MSDGARGVDEVGTLTERQRRRLTRPRRDGAIIATLCFAGLVVSFMQTIVIPIAPQLPQLLNTNPSDANWVLSATLLASAIATPIAGRLGDMYGKRRIALGLLGLLIIGCAIAALSNDIVPMIVARVLQGVSFGLVPLGISIMRDTVRRKHLAGAVALMSATLGVGGSLGLPIGAFVSQTFDFHVLFWVAAGLGALSLALVSVIVPPSTLRSGGRFDLIGALGFAIGLIAILLAVSKGDEWGWASVPILSLFVGGAGVLVLWGLFELKAPSPLVDLRVAARRPVLFTNLASLAVGFAYFASQAALPSLLESPAATGVGFGLPLFIASLCLMPIGIIQFVGSPFGARFSLRYSPRLSVIIGMLIIGATYFAAVALMHEVWQIIVIATAIGVGLAFAYSAIPLLIMRSVPFTETAAANGLNAVMRSVGSSVSAALVGVLLASGATVVDGHAVASQSAFQLVFVIGGAASVFSALMAWLIPRKAPEYTTASIPTIPSPKQKDAVRSLS